MANLVILTSLLITSKKDFGVIYGLPLYTKTFDLDKSNANVKYALFGLVITSSSAFFIAK